jgi:hypothetical protein
MPYVVPNTFAAGAISAPALQENVDEMRDYVDGNIASADLAATNWVKSKHIMRGHYDPIVNTHSFATGVDGGRVASDIEMSFIGDGPTGRNQPADPDKVAYPNATMDFYLSGAADVVFQFSAYPHTPDLLNDNNYHKTKLYIYLNNTQIVESEEITSHISAATGRGEFWLAHAQNAWSGFYVAKNLSAGRHSIGLRGVVEGRYSFLTKWSVSLEAFYR